MGSNVDANKAFKVLVIGGSYGGLSAALNLQDLCSLQAPRCGPKPDATSQQPGATTAAGKEPISVEITVVDERDGYYHLIGSPLAFASSEYAEKAWVKFEDIPELQAPNITTIQGSVQAVDCASKTSTIALHGSNEQLSLDYDYLIVTSGLRRVFPVVPQSLRKKQYLVETGDFVHNVTNSPHGVVVVGGGAVGIEMAAELKVAQPDTKVFLAHSRDKLLSSEPLPDDCRDKALELVLESGVEVLMSHRLDKAEDTTADDGTKAKKLTFTNGHTMLASEVIMAISHSAASSDFLPKEALDPHGLVCIQPSLAFPVNVANAADHFAAGDLVSWSGIKRCGGAMHMGYFAATNVHQLMLQKLYGTKPKFLELEEIPPMIGLAVGKKALSYWPEGGTTTGEDVMEMFFGDDLGFTICWDHLQLGGRKAA